jgi:hypothetical protein
VIIDDPGAYTRPFTLCGSHTYAADAKLMEFICNDNNQDVAHIVGRIPATSTHWSKAARRHRKPFDCGGQPVRPAATHRGRAGARNRGLTF